MLVLEFVRGRETDHKVEFKAPYIRGQWPDVKDIWLNKDADEREGCPPKLRVTIEGTY